MTFSEALLSAALLAAGLQLLATGPAGAGTFDNIQATAPNAFTDLERTAPRGPMSIEVVLRLDDDAEAKITAPLVSERSDDVYGTLKANAP